MPDTPLTFRMSNTLFKFVLSVRHLSSMDSNNCLQVASNILEFDCLCDCNSILIAMIITNSGYSLLALPLGRGVVKDGLLVGWKLTKMLTETRNTVWMKILNIKWHIL